MLRIIKGPVVMKIKRVTQLQEELLIKNKNLQYKILPIFSDAAFSSEAEQSQCHRKIYILFE